MSELLNNDFNQENELRSVQAILSSIRTPSMKPGVPLSVIPKFIRATAENVASGKSMMPDFNEPSIKVGDELHVDAIVEYIDIYNHMLQLSQNDGFCTGQNQIKVDDFTDIKFIKEKYKWLINTVAMAYPNEIFNTKSEEFKNTFNSLRSCVREIAKFNEDPNKNVILVVKDFLINLSKKKYTDTEFESRLKEFLGSLETQGRIITYVIDLKDTEKDPYAENELHIKTRDYQELKEYAKIGFRFSSQIEYIRKIEDSVFQKWSSTKDDFMAKKFSFSRRLNPFFPRTSSPTQSEPVHDYIADVIEMIRMDAVPFEKAVVAIEHCEKIDLIKFIIQLQDKQKKQEEEIEAFKNKYYSVAGNVKELLSDLVNKSNI